MDGICILHPLNKGFYGRTQQEKEYFDMQNQRQEQLLTILSELGDWITSRRLAVLLQVSDRTIRSDVESINRNMTPPPIESNVRRGYRICENASLSPLPPKESRGTDIPQTPGAR